jgi:acyl-coenzyme A thioesterase PaaI-like protein
MHDLILTDRRQAVPFARHVGVELLTMGDGEASAQLAKRPEGLNHIATHHAGALFTLVEAASGAAMAGLWRRC